MPLLSKSRALLRLSNAPMTSFRSCPRTHSRSCPSWVLRPRLSALLSALWTILAVAEVRAKLHASNRFDCKLIVLGCLILYSIVFMFHFIIVLGPSNCILSCESVFESHQTLLISHPNCIIILTHHQQVKCLTCSAISQHGCII